MHKLSGLYLMCSLLDHYQQRSQTSASIGRALSAALSSQAWPLVSLLSLRLHLFASNKLFVSVYISLLLMLKLATLAKDNSVPMTALVSCSSEIKQSAIEAHTHLARRSRRVDHLSSLRHLRARLSSPY